MFYNFVLAIQQVIITTPSWLHLGAILFPKDFQEMVREAHAKDMYVIMDVVINHTGDNWSYPGGHPYYFWKYAPGPFDFGFWRESDPDPGLQSCDAAWPKEFQQVDFYKRRGRITDWNDPDQAVNGDFEDLKELNTNRFDVLNTLIAVYKYWIATTNIDGFRIDTVKHLEESFTALFCNAIREYAKMIGKHNFFIYGEIFANDFTIQKYLGRNARIDGTNERFPSLDSSLDFELFYILGPVIKGFKSPTELRERYERFKNNYADHGDAGRYFVTFFASHDQNERFLHNNPFQKQALLATGYLLTSQGIPCNYYGTEQGFDGGGPSDQYVRECMFGGKWGAFNTTGVQFFNEQHPLYQEIRKIVQIRKNESPLRYGRMYFREISGDRNLFGFPTIPQCTLAFSRILDTTEIIIAMNLEAIPRQDYITVDRNLTPPGSKVLDLVTERISATVEEVNGRACVKVALQGHQLAIFKLLH
jgi:glycosidase